MKLEQGKNEELIIRFRPSARQTFIDLSLILVAALALVSFAMLTIFLGFHVPASDLTLCVFAGSAFIVTMLFLARKSGRRLVHKVVCTQDRICTVNLFRRQWLLDLNGIILMPEYTISPETNQMIKYKLLVIMEESGIEKDFLFHRLPPEVFVAILKYYDLNVSGFRKRKFRQQPLSAWQKRESIANIIVLYMAIPLICTVIGLAAMFTQGIEPGIWMFAAGAAGVCYAIYRIILIRRR